MPAECTHQAIAWLNAQRVAFRVKSDVPFFLIQSTPYSAHQSSLALLSSINFLFLPSHSRISLLIDSSTTQSSLFHPEPGPPVVSVEKEAVSTGTAEMYPIMMFGINASIGLCSPASPARPFVSTTRLIDLSSQRFRPPLIPAAQFLIWASTEGTAKGSVVGMDGSVCASRHRHKSDFEIESKVSRFFGER